MHLFIGYPTRAWRGPGVVSLALHSLTDGGTLLPVSCTFATEAEMDSLSIAFEGKGMLRRYVCGMWKGWELDKSNVLTPSAHKATTSVTAKQRRIPTLFSTMRSSCNDCIVEGSGNREREGGLSGHNYSSRSRFMSRINSSKMRSVT